MNTILVRDDSLAPTRSEEYYRHRREHVEAFAIYKRSLRTHIGSDDSLVREYSLLDGRYAVLEQRISVCVRKNGEAWLGIASMSANTCVWMDNEKDLGVSSIDPWMTANNVAVLSFLIIQHYPKMTARNFASDTSASGENRMPQSGSMLPLQYDSLLFMVYRSRQTSREPFDVLAPLFGFVAFSEVQFLNLIEG